MTTFDLSCADCSKPMARNPKSLPPGQARCQPCRRLARGLAPDQSVRGALAGTGARRCRLRQCRKCDAPVPDGRYSYCSAACGRRREAFRRPTTASRGYGSAHQILRARLLPQAYGEDCHLCGAVMLPSQELHLDHTPDRSGYRGITHGWCNTRDGLQRAAEVARRKRLGVTA